MSTQALWFGSGVGLMWLLCILLEFSWNDLGSILLRFWFRSFWLVLVESNVLRYFWFCWDSDSELVWFFELVQFFFFCFWFFDGLGYCVWFCCGPACIRIISVVFSWGAKLCFICCLILLGLWMSKFFWVGSIGIEVLFCLGQTGYCSDWFCLFRFFWIFWLLHSVIVTARTRVLWFGVGVVLVRFCFIVLAFWFCWDWGFRFRLFWLVLVESSLFGSFTWFCQVLDCLECWSFNFIWLF